MRMVALLGALVWLLFSTELAISMVRAQPPTKPHTSSCEIHVWPGSSLGSVYQGLLRRRDIVNAGVNGRDGYPTLASVSIDTAAQQHILSQIPIGDWVNLPDYRTILHDKALESRIIRSTPGRIAASTSPCYAELVVDDVILQQDTVNGGRLKALFHFREFGDNSRPQRSFTAWTTTKISAFSTKLASSEDFARADIQQAFRNNVELFADYLLRSEQSDK